MKQRNILKERCQPGRMFLDQRDAQRCKLVLMRRMDCSADINGARRLCKMAAGQKKLAALYRANSLFYLSSDLFCDTAKRKTLCLSDCIILTMSALFYFFRGPLLKTLWISTRNRLPFCLVATKGCRYQRAGNDPLGICVDLFVEETDACLKMQWSEHDVIHRYRGEGAPNNAAVSCAGCHVSAQKWVKELNPVLLLAL